MKIVMILSACVFLVYGMGAQADLRAGVATVSITPLEENIPTPLGGYGARNGEPATGVLDTVNAKCLVFDWNGAKSALVTLDACSVPLCVVEESLKKAAVDGLTVENVLMAASHSHTGLEGFSMDRRNIANNPHIGVFSEPVLNFVTDRIAQGLKQAASSLEPVVASSGSVDLPGMNRNRRGDSFTDPGMTVFRLDAGNKPLAVFVNFTAHGTFVGPKEMLVSGEWAGQMQRTVEALMPGVTCLYANGAEGDQSPVEPKAGSRYQQAENYGRNVGIAAAKLAEKIKPAPVKQFEVAMQWVKLPPRKGAPDFVKIAGDEYHVTQEQLDQILPLMFPDQAPIYALRINDFELVSFPGEPICQLGLAVKDTMRQAGIAHPCVTSNTGDGIGYILTADEYAQSGYEVTASFYGDGLGQIMLDAATAMAKQVAQPAK
ncbi:MAG TPA: neutral/alkaline non-lysosomal ceramidase N-terminal domain-containing protein [Candidatus Bathyarchaeia archaeon]|nr:neutral/alkaline non-lysosomal ceramidase N-terminal domain-containing protein [Candidatus Bathyarchaeia archaeon]